MALSRDVRRQRTDWDDEGRDRRADARNKSGERCELGADGPVIGKRWERNRVGAVFCPFASKRLT